MMAQELAVLPEDVLVEVLRRLPSHSIAASRCVCKAWRDAVDARLRPHLLSRSVRGIFINNTKHDMSEFFSRPSTGPAICGGLDFVPAAPPMNGVKVTDHCNGLVLCRDWEHDYVVNPATQRWARLPQRPPAHLWGFQQTAYLAFDHAVSPHYEVYLIPCVPHDKPNYLNLSTGSISYVNRIDKTLLETEWPPAAHVMHVFSSMTQRWDKKTFLREGEAAGFVADMANNSFFDQHYAVYWRGALYIHGQRDFLMRMCLSNYKYKVIKMPVQSSIYPHPRLGRSMRGVYCAVPYIYSDNGLQLWYLDESCGQMKWVLKHDVDLESFGRKFHLSECYAQQTDKQWILQDVNYRKCSRFEHDRRKYGDYEAPLEEKYEWNSDDDNILDTEEHAVDEARWSQRIGLLGFHPYKEIVFLSVGLEEAVAYHWNSSKFQYLGSVLPKHYDELRMEGSAIDTYFPYTPCWMYEFPGMNSVSRLEGEQLSAKRLDSTRPPVMARWKKPVQGVFKINVDACFHEEMQGATSLVVRDHVGSLISAQALWHAHAASPMIMEAIAIRDAVKLAMERGYHQVEIESDDQEVVKLMKKPGFPRSEIASIIQEVKMLSDFFTTFRITCVGTTANVAAYTCANRANAERRRCLWINYKPQFLIDILENDCINSE